MSVEIILPMVLSSECWWYRLLKDPPLFIKEKMSIFLVRVYRWSTLLRDPLVLLDIIVPILYVIKCWWSRLLRELLMLVDDK